jgi:hypothetical protein
MNGIIIYVKIISSGMIPAAITKFHAGNKDISNCVFLVMIFHVFSQEFFILLFKYGSMCCWGPSHCKGLHQNRQLLHQSNMIVYTLQKHISPTAMQSLLLKVMVILVAGNLVRGNFVPGIFVHGNLNYV